MNAAPKHSIRPRVLAIGGANRDEVMRLAGALHLRVSNRVQTLAMTGGIARNVAQNLVALGVGAQLLTAVGDDEIGAWVLSQTAAAGVDVSLAVTHGELATGRYIAVLEENGDLALGLADMAAVESLGTEDIQTASLAVKNANAVFADANLMPDTLAALVAIAADHNTPVTMDLVSPVKAKRLGPDLSRIDMVVGNCGEAASLLGTGGSAVEMACAIVAKGALTAVISDGGQPLGWCDRDSDCSKVRSGTLIPLPTEIVDVTGAGDALHSGIIAARLEGASVEDASRFGLEVARRVVSSPDHALTASSATKSPVT